MNPSCMHLLLHRQSNELLPVIHKRIYKTAFHSFLPFLLEARNIEVVFFSLLIDTTDNMQEAITAGLTGTV